jgi:hypothetical protein
MHSDGVVLPAVGSDETESFSSADGEGHVGKGCDRSVAFREPGDTEHARRLDSRFGDVEIDGQSPAGSKIRPDPGYYYQQS